MSKELKAQRRLKLTAAAVPDEVAEEFSSLHKKLKGAGIITDPFDPKDVRAHQSKVWTWMPQIKQYTYFTLDVLQNVIKRAKFENMHIGFELSRTGNSFIATIAQGGLLTSSEIKQITASHIKASALKNSKKLRLSKP